MKKKSLLSALTLCILFVFAACGDDDPMQNTDVGTLNFEIEGQMGDQELQIESETYAAQSAVEGFRLSRISFFLSDIRLIAEENGQLLETPLAEVAYFDLGTAQNSIEIFQNVPVGEYSGIRFNFGLTPEQDETKPEDYSPSHPLGRTAEYWVDWGSYIFAKIEGKSDTTANGQERFDAPFVFHVGIAIDNTKQVQLSMPFEMTAETKLVKLDFDAAELLKLNQADELPLTEFDHGGRYATRIVDAAVSAFSVAE